MSNRTRRTVRVAAVQMACPALRFDENLEKARAFAEAAAQKGAQVVLLPELFRAGDPKLSLHLAERIKNQI
jgi:predicted amidohydrolase